MIEKLEFKVPDLKFQKSADVKAAYIELANDYIRYFIHMTAEEPINKEDPDLGWNKDVLSYFDIVVDKFCIVAVEFTNNIAQDTPLWQLNIIGNGLGQDLKLFFEKRKEGRLFYTKLLKWWKNIELDT